MLESLQCKIIVQNSSPPTILSPIRLLREALSGNCKTVMIAHVNPGLSHREESKNTLVYAARATGISHKVSTLHDKQMFFPELDEKYLKFSLKNQKS